MHSTLLPLLCSVLGVHDGANTATSENTAPEPESVLYRVRQTTRLDQIPDGAKKIDWWISIPGNERDQDVLDFEVLNAPGAWSVQRDATRGNSFLHVEIDAPAADALDAVVEFVLRRESTWIDVDPDVVGPITDSHRVFFRNELTHDAPNMEVTDQILDIADDVCGDETNVAFQVEALLNYVADEADHYSKDPTKPSCGIGNAGACLTNRGGCCTDLHSLFIALTRARGIPARLQMGYRLLEKNVGLEVNPGYRCWAEFFAPGYGWVPADIVEADAGGTWERSRWFSGLTARRLWLNQGREFTFEGAASTKPVNHMSIGYAEIDGVPARVLDEGDLAAQLSRTVRFIELADDAASARFE